MGWPREAKEIEALNLWSRQIHNTICCCKADLAVAILLCVDKDSSPLLYPSIENKEMKLFRKIPRLVGSRGCQKLWTLLISIKSWCCMSISRRCKHGEMLVSYHSIVSDTALISNNREASEWQELRMNRSCYIVHLIVISNVASSFYRCSQDYPNWKSRGNERR